jgi:hypothetical protein
MQSEPEKKNIRIRKRKRELGNQRQGKRAEVLMFQGYDRPLFPYKI